MLDIAVTSTLLYHASKSRMKVALISLKNLTMRILFHLDKHPDDANNTEKEKKKYPTSFFIGFMSSNSSQRQNTQKITTISSNHNSP